MTDDFEHNFMYFFVIYVYSLVKCSWQLSYSNFLIGFFLLLLNFESSLFRYFPLSDMWFDFLLVCSLSFYPLSRIFWRGKVLILIKSNLSVFPFIGFAFIVKSKNDLPTPKSYMFSPVCFSNSFVLHLNLWSILS